MRRRVRRPGAENLWPGRPRLSTVAAMASAQAGEATVRCAGGGEAAAHVRRPAFPAGRPGAAGRRSR
ncbi:hypothetical protein D7294_07645 [Streptomyces hoynatensis]|uniref:Uncharacterized protein n=1 Tax=Streptomyces hoynatensis TaxID=1141874 RepID=A0A3A9ZA25_9ACTN|nr:hypothetical protein D7294_07645 [Streptomyces hoynatensis]